MTLVIRLGFEQMNHSIKRINFGKRNLLENSSYEKDQRVDSYLSTRKLIENTEFLYTISAQCTRRKWLVGMDWILSKFKKERNSAAGSYEKPEVVQNTLSCDL